MASVFDSISQPLQLKPEAQKPSIFSRIAEPIKQVASGAAQQTLKGLGLLSKFSGLELAGEVVDQALGMPGQAAAQLLGRQAPIKASEQVGRLTTKATGSEKLGSIASFGALLAEPLGIPGKAGKVAQFVSDLAKEEDAAKVASMLTKDAKALSKEQVAEVAPRIASAKTEQEVQTILDETIKKPAEVPVKAEAPAEPPKPPVEPPFKVPDAPVPESSDAAVAKLAELIKSAKPIAKDIKTEQSAERSARIARVVKSGYGSGAVKEGAALRYKSALGKLKGELASKEKFSSIRDQLTASELDSLFFKIESAKHYLPYERVAMQNSLAGLLRGEIPQPKQLKNLEDIFGPNIVSALKRHIGTNTEALLDTINIPRSLVTSLDMSALLRQGLVASVRHPVSAARAFKGTLPEIFSQKNFEKWIDELKSAPDYPEMKRHGLYIADPRSLAEGLTGREEAFMSKLVEKIPGIGASQRAYVGMLNKLRVDIYRNLSKQFKEQGTASPKDLDSLAELINVTTGRGKLGRNGERIAPLLNGIFFSPRLIAARLSLLNPKWYANQTPAVRKEAIKTMASFVGAGLTVLSLAKLGGADVEADPRSTDFGKIRVGDTRWDIWGGFQQWVRVFSQLIPSPDAEGNLSWQGHKKTAKGRVVPLSEKEFPFESRADVVGNFILGKLAPGPALALELARGQNMVGEPTTVSETSLDNTLPLYFRDIYDAYKEGGPAFAAAAGVPAFFGVGLQSYGSGSPTGAKPSGLPSLKLKAGGAGIQRETNIKPTRKYKLK